MIRRLRSPDTSLPDTSLPASDVGKRLLRKVNNSIGIIVNLIDRLIHCQKGLLQVVTMFAIITLSTYAFISVGLTLLLGGSLLAAGSEFIILTFLGGQIFSSLDSMCRE